MIVYVLSSLCLNLITLSKSPPTGLAGESREIGDLWREGSLTAAREHFASAVMRVFLVSAETAWLAGIRAMPACLDDLVRIRAVAIADLTQLGEALDGLRHPARRAKQ